MIHMKTALYAGIVVASPYIIYQLFRFVSPALYDNERKYATALVSSGYLMFMLGTLLNYVYGHTHNDESGDGHRFRTASS